MKESHFLGPGQQRQHQLEAQVKIKRTMTYAITRIKRGLGPGVKVPLRREIDERWFSKDMNDLIPRSLFIYALHQLQNKPPNSDDPSDLSYFTIAGAFFSTRLAIAMLKLNMTQQAYTASPSSPGIQSHQKATFMALVGPLCFQLGTGHTYISTSKNYMKPCSS